VIHTSQKMLLHVYAQAGGINDPTYRNVLRALAGVSSAADPAMTQTGFEQAMASLETMLFTRVHAGDVPSPIGKSRYIQSEFYWRKKLPQTGLINSRQRSLIDQLWNRLFEFLPQEKADSGYLAAMIVKATGRHVDVWNLSHQEAGCVIDALKDRLSYAIRGAGNPETQVLEAIHEPAA